MSDRSIRRLSDATVNQIAAGEVITRPSRVVEELLDNAIDAAASRITIEVESDGTDRITVSDTGHGIARKDVIRALERHTTSKIQPENTTLTESVQTLGFRGEALAAIADCATVTVETNTGEPRGTKITTGPDDEPVRRDVGHAQGTTVTASNLFANRPARNASLAKPETEFRRITEVVSAYALLYPQIRFVLRHNGTETLSTTGTGITASVLGVYGRKAAQHTRSIDHRQAVSIDHGGTHAPRTTETQTVRISGFLLAPTIVRRSNTHTTVAINGRPVRQSAIRDAVVSGYGSRLGSKEYPIAAISVTVPHSLVDPNIHPAKQRVGLVGEDEIAAAVSKAIETALTSGDERIAAQTPTDLTTELADTTPDSRFDRLTVIGTFRELYILCEAADELLVIDQHAAHERVNYERLQAAFATEPIRSEPIDPPQTVSLSATAQAAMEEFADELTACGYEYELFGGTVVRVTAVPAPFGRPANPGSLQDVLTALQQGIERPPREQFLASLACHPSLKAGDSLSVDDAQLLLDRLAECESPYRCPHGRPVMTTLSERSIAQQLGRNVSRFR